MRGSPRGPWGGDSTPAGAGVCARRVFGNSHFLIRPWKPQGPLLGERANPGPREPGSPRSRGTVVRPRPLGGAGRSSPGRPGPALVSLCTAQSGPAGGAAEPCAVRPDALADLGPGGGGSEGLGGPGVQTPRSTGWELRGPLTPRPSPHSRQTRRHRRTASPSTPPTLQRSSSPRGCTSPTSPSGSGTPTCGKCSG